MVRAGRSQRAADARRDRCGDCRKLRDGIANIQAVAASLASSEIRDDTANGKPHPVDAPMGIIQVTLWWAE
jgi:hypothetical protein